MKKWQVVVSIICLILCVISLIFAAIYKKNQNSKDAYFILDNNTNYEYSASKGFSIVDDSEIQSLNLLFNTYENGQYIGDYYFSKVNSWNLFDKKSEYKSYNGHLFAYHGKMDLKVDNIKSRNINEEEKILISNKYGIYNFDYLFTNQVYEVDLNNDEVIDKIICVSNNSVDMDTRDMYNLIIFVIGDEIKTIIKELNVTTASVYSVKNIFNINNNVYKYIVIESIDNYNGDIESYKVTDMIYEYKKGNYTNVTFKK